MSWLPPINRVLILIKHIETDEDPLRHSSELFWLFCTQSQTQEEYISRIAWWKDYHARQTQEGGGFADPDVEALMMEAFNNPQKAADTIADRLDDLAKTKRVTYIPDQKDDSARLYLNIHIEASRLTRLLKLEGYSERTRESLESALNSFHRYKQAQEQSDLQYSTANKISIYLVGSFLYVAEFWLKKADGRYEDAILSLSEGINNYQEASGIYYSHDAIKIIDPEYDPDGITDVKDSYLTQYLPQHQDIFKSIPWLQELRTQVIVDCFEALRGSGDIKEINKLIEFTDTLYYISEQLWPSEDKYAEVQDASGYYWGAVEYWQYISGWLEAQLQPSIFKELINEREDEAAEKRLKTYFFGNELWNKLPERAKRSLISADRDWFSGTSARLESVLNELKITAEELLLHGLWIPLEDWVKRPSRERQDIQEFFNLEHELSTNRWQPDLFHFECVCKMSVTKIFLQDRNVTLSEQDWFAEELPISLSKLRFIRKRAEHISVGGWTRQGIHQFVTEFIGIGRPGVLPRLVEVLFSFGRTGAR